MVPARARSIPRILEQISKERSLELVMVSNCGQSLMMEPIPSKFGVHRVEKAVQELGTVEKVPE